MDQIAKNLVPIRIEDEMRNSYMDYSMSVIIGRALPDVRDGLKPVHRRILYAMHREGLASNKKYSKCAGVVGEVLKRFHPHGDGAVYDALVRMAQPWNLRYMLVDGQGNFGSVDGDPAAAYRYTECRMTKLAEEMLTDIDKDTVSFIPNYNGEDVEPTVLPSRFPNLLVNGADGIAVGMATKIPPHNLTEIVDGCITFIENPDVTIDELMELIPGPDFPTGATIYGRDGVRSAYRTGRGRIIVRGRAQTEELSGGRPAIIIDELPFQVNKARLILQIADLVRDKKLDGIHGLRDESDRSGMRIVIELKYDAYDAVVLNRLYKHTSLQSTFGVIMLAIVNQRPRILTLKEMITLYVAHRREVVLRRTRYLLRRARERAHILEGYRIALDHIDEVIALIRASPTVGEARVGLMNRFGLSEVQAQAILDLRLQRLTGMEREKIEAEYNELMATIADLEDILGSEIRLMGVVKAELLEIREQYGDERRTRFVETAGDLSIRDLVAAEEQVVTLSHHGYIKRCSPTEWRQQARGGMGKRGMTTKEADFVETLFIANTHDVLLVFTSQGRAYPLNVYDVPHAGRSAKGRPIINLVPVEQDESIAAVERVITEDGRINEDTEGELMFFSRRGLVKRTPLNLYRNIRQSGIIAVGVADGDELSIVRRVDDSDRHVMLFSRAGKCIRFDMEQAPIFGRTARGNKGMALSGGSDEVVDALLVPTHPTPDEDAVDDDDEPIDELLNDELDENGEPVEIEERYESSLMTVTALGYGKRTYLDEYRPQKRAGKGKIAYRTTTKTGEVVGALHVAPDDHVMLVTNTGRVIRIRAGSARVIGRNTQGVRLMRLDDGERIVDIARIDGGDVVEEETDEASVELTDEVASGTADSTDGEE
jgi:DNA gyrase subunit A